MYFYSAHNCRKGVFTNSWLYLNRHVMLPRELSKQVPKTHLMSEEEWRRLGVQQSLGWVHYMIHEPGKFCHLGRH